MTTLNVILDDLLVPAPGSSVRYAGELTRALIHHAPPGCFVEGIIGASTEPEYESVNARLPGLAGLFKSALTRRDLTTAWQHGFTPVPSGMIHAPSLFAPLRRHDRVNTRGNQIAVTIHDVTAWTHPEYLASRQVGWTKSMAQRAHRYADAVVVPTHAIAAELDEIMDFGERVRVIGSAVSANLFEPDDADERAGRLGLPERYLLTIGEPGDGHGIEHLLAALATPGAEDLPLVVLGNGDPSDALHEAATAAGLSADRVRLLGRLADEDLSVAYSRATAFVYPKLADGFGMPMLEAFRFGTPVIHSDVPSLVEVAGDAGLIVPVSDLEALPRELADAIERVTTDDELRRTLGILGEDRAAVFSWRASAEGVWQLHADL